MAAYEITLMLKASISDAELDRLLFSVGEKLTDQGGEILLVEDWGLRTLAYKVQMQRRARFVMLLAASAVDEVTSAEEIARAHTATLRVLITPTERTLASTVEDFVTQDAFDTVDVTIKYRSSKIANESELEIAATEFMRSLGYRSIPYATVTSPEQAEKSRPLSIRATPKQIRGHAEK